MSTTAVEQLVEAVGVEIWDHDYTLAEAQECNRDEGWTVELRLAGREYLSSTDYTRLDQVRLTDAELERAFWDVAMTLGRPR